MPSSVMAPSLAGVRWTCWGALDCTLRTFAMLAATLRPEYSLAAVWQCGSSAVGILHAGSNNNGQTTVPSGLSDVIQITAGNRHSCALRREGTIACWGELVARHLASNQVLSMSGTGSAIGLSEVCG